MQMILLPDVHAEELDVGSMYTQCVFLRGGLGFYLKVKDSALLITIGNKNSLGSCSHIRTTLSTHLESEQYHLIKLTILGNWFVLPKISKYTTIYFIHIKGQLSTLRTIIYFLNYFMLCSSTSTPLLSSVDFETRV